jgi:hypothetical protein
MSLKNLSRIINKGRGTAGLVQIYFNFQYFNGFWAEKHGKDREAGPEINGCFVRLNLSQ